MSFIPLLLLLVSKKTGERGEMREGRREELTGLRQTQRMAAAVDPCCPPLCSKNTYTSLLLKKKGPVVYFEDYFPKCQDVNSTFGVSDQVDRGCSVR